MFPFRCRILFSFSFSSFFFIYVFRLSYPLSFVAPLLSPGLFRFELLYGIFVVGYGSTPILLLISFSFFSFLPFFHASILSACHPHPPHRFSFSTADLASLFPFFDYYFSSYSSLLALCIVHLLFWLAIDTEVVPFGWI